VISVETLVATAAAAGRGARAAAKCLRGSEEADPGRQVVQAPGVAPGCKGRPTFCIIYGTERLENQQSSMTNVVCASASA
jgi:hypothetical protein